MPPAVQQREENDSSRVRLHADGGAGGKQQSALGPMLHIAVFSETSERNRFRSFCHIPELNDFYGGAR